MYKRRISHLQQARPADIKQCPTYIKDMPTRYKGVHLYMLRTTWTSRNLRLNVFLFLVFIAFNASRKACHLI